MQLRLIDRYVLGLPLGNVVGIIMSLMVLEHIPRLIGCCQSNCTGPN